MQIDIRKEKQQFAPPQFERREVQAIENELFDSLSDAVKDELETFGLTAGTVGRRFGPVNEPFYLNDKRHAEYLTITKDMVQKSLDQLMGSAKYKNMESKAKEDAIQAAISKAKSDARDELTGLIDSGQL